MQGGHDGEMHDPLPEDAHSEESDQDAYSKQKSTMFVKETKQV